MKKDKRKIRFLDIQDDLIKAINKKGKRLGITEKATLIEGFLSNPINVELTNNIVIGGPILPMVVFVGEETGRVYFFALKVLLPDIEDGITN